MKILLLPRYSGKPGRRPAGAEGTARRPSKRGTRLIDLAWLAAILIFLWWLRRTTDAIELSRTRPEPPALLDFRLVKERFAMVFMASREDVEHLLGPPTEHHVWEAEFAEAEKFFENGGKNPMPEPIHRVWDKWSDPKDPSRWVAVLYGGYSHSAQVFAFAKRGF